MPVIATTAYGTAEGVLNAARALVNDLRIVVVGGSITTAARALGMTTITTSSAHGLLAGQTATIAGVADGSFNGSFLLTTAPTSTTFTYQQTGAPDTTSSGGQVSSSGGDVLTDVAPFTFQYLNTAYHHVQFELAVNGIETFEREVILTDVPAVAGTNSSVQVVINDSGTNNGTQSFARPQLPTDLLVPLRLWERQNGSTESFIPMVQPKDGLASVLQTRRLMVWEWRYDGIYTPGATQQNDIRIRYEAIPPDLASPSDPVLIRGAQNVMAFLVAQQFAAARGSQMTAIFALAAERALEQMFLRASRRQQHTAHRRRPYSWRRRMGGGIWY